MKWIPQGILFTFERFSAFSSQLILNHQWTPIGNVKRNVEIIELSLTLSKLVAREFRDGFASTNRCSLTFLARETLFERWKIGCEKRGNSFSSQRNFPKYRSSVRAARFFSPFNVPWNFSFSPDAGYLRVYGEFMVGNTLRTEDAEV